MSERWRITLAPEAIRAVGECVEIRHVGGQIVLTRDNPEVNPEDNPGLARVLALRLRETVTAAQVTATEAGVRGWLESLDLLAH